MGHVWLTDDWDGKQRLLLALIGDVLPGVWREAAEKAAKRVGVLAGYESLRDLRAALLAADPSPAVVAALRQSGRQLVEARQAGTAGQYVQAIDGAASAHETAVKAWCLGRSSLAPEFRAFWCHSAFGLPEKTWDEAIAFLAKNGFNAILPNMLWAGVAYYPSKVLPVHSSVAEKGDQIAQCLAACRRYGVECHVWKVNWNMGSHADAAFVKKMVAAGRVQQGIDGAVQERWLCPSHPENQALEIASMVELARLYDLDGIHFDYIRYPGRNHCFCAGCRQRFEKLLGKPVTDWPQAVRTDETLRRAWLDWRRSNITAVVAAVSEQARAVRPGIKISAAVFRNWPVDRDGVGQDWKLWCEKGYLDFVCPMDYTESNQTFRNFVVNQLEWAAGKPCYPGIGLSVWADPRDAVKLIQQIEISRGLKTGGFTVFNFGANVEPVLPYLVLGTTAKQESAHAH